MGLLGALSGCGHISVQNPVHDLLLDVGQDEIFRDRVEKSAEEKQRQSARTQVGY